jgi:single-strand selective monofunctional uracil DNA glycosylase
VSLDRITAELARELTRLRFGPPVTHVYNPLDYARAPYREYLRRFGKRPRQIVRWSG